MASPALLVTGGGTTLIENKYSLVEQLRNGAGYYGVTWLAQDVVNNRKACIKMFYTSSPEQATNQGQELKILRDLLMRHFDHEHLCKVLDVYEGASAESGSGNSIGPLPCVAFEFCENGDLFGCLVDCPIAKWKRVWQFDEALARHYFGQAVKGLLYLHTRNVFHRDIKPENFLLDGNFNLKITDFGTNKVLASASESDPLPVLRAMTSTVGTEVYRAPEVQRIDGYDPSSFDMWSMGVVLFFMVGVHVMYQKAVELSDYERRWRAPLGIYFPFPFELNLLDSYLSPQSELQQQFSFGAGHQRTMENDQFWDKWYLLKCQLSPELLNLLNRFFFIEPTMRITLNDVCHHPWMQIKDHFTPDDIRDAMEKRVLTVVPSAKPDVSGFRTKGGDDQTSLRLSMSKGEAQRYASDDQCWQLDKTAVNLEACQVELVGDDVTVVMPSLMRLLGVFGQVLKAPEEDESRTLQIDHWSEPELALFKVAGFMPEDTTLFLPNDRLHMDVLQQILDLLHALEEACARDVIELESSARSTLSSTAGTPSMSIDGRDLSLPPEAELYSRSMSLQPSTPPVHHRRRSNSLPSRVQGSGTSCQAGIMSDYFAVDNMPFGEEILRQQKVLHLKVRLDFTTAGRHYRAAREYCRVSGLLSSYGLYQAVFRDQLALFCRGKLACFSARIMNCSGEIVLSCWCFKGFDEFDRIFARLQSDVT